MEWHGILASSRNRRYGNWLSIIAATLCNLPKPFLCHLFKFSNLLGLYRITTIERYTAPRCQDNFKKRIRWMPFCHKFVEFRRSVFREYMHLSPPVRPAVHLRLDGRRQMHFIAVKAERPPVPAGDQAAATPLFIP